MKKKFVLYPFLFAIYPIVFLYVHNASQLFSAKDVLVPMIVIVSLAFVFSYLLSFVCKDEKKVGLLVSLTLLLFFSYGHVYNLVDSFFVNDVIQKLVIRGIEVGPNKILFPLWCVLFIIGIFYSSRTQRDLHNITKTLNVVAISLVLVSISSIVPYAFEASKAAGDNIGVQKKQLNLQVSPQADRLPDIYYIILDAYTSSNTLKKVFNYDNSGFTDRLVEKGFVVTSNSHSNYASTELSITSALNMKYLNYLSVELGAGSKDLSVLNKMVKDNRVRQFLKTKGYKYIHFSSGWAITDNNPLADLEFKHRYSNEFSVLVLLSSMLNPFVKKYVQKDLRSAILSTFYQIAEIPAIEEPTFVFAHMLTPHELNNTQEKGYVFAENYEGQFPILNREIEILVDAILSKSDTPPIIIIQGDHGTSTTGNFKQPTEKLFKERMSIFNAYYLPNEGSNHLYDSITPVNSFRLVFNHYLGAGLKLLEDRSYFSDYDNRYKFIDVTNVL